MGLNAEGGVGERGAREGFFKLVESVELGLVVIEIFLKDFRVDRAAAREVEIFGFFLVGFSFVLIGEEAGAGTVEVDVAGFVIDKNRDGGSDGSNADTDDAEEEKITVWLRRFDRWRSWFCFYHNSLLIFSTAV